MSKRLSCLMITTVLLTVACGSGEDAGGSAKSAGGSAEPDRVTVQHILIGFTGSIPGKQITRSRGEAQQLAEEVLKRAQDGEAFDALVRENTDDSAPGIYKMANRGVPPDPTQKRFARDSMVAAFGDVGFPLDVGQIGMAAYDPRKSPFGWHIIKRIE